MPCLVSLEPPRKRQEPDDDLEQPQHQSKRLKLGGPPPAYWDNLSRIWLTIVESGQRPCRPLTRQLHATLKHRCQIPALDPLRGCKHENLKEHTKRCLMATNLFRHATFDVHALCQLASSLHGGRSCSCDVTQVPADGSLYWAAFLVFDDGVEWVFRSPRRDGAIQSEKTIQALLASEAATLKYIKSYSAIPVPVKSLGSRESTLSLKEKSKIVFQLGVITWQLSHLRFREIGSLFEESGYLQVRGLTGLLQHVECLQLSHHCFSPCPTRNRYDDDQEYHRACDQWNNFVTLGSKIDGSNNRVDYTVVGDCLRGITSKWAEEMSASAQNIGSERFPLHHPDLNVNNIFVGDNCSITCIIDWAFCSSVPFPILLMAPGLPQSRDRLEAPLITAFEDGLRRAILTDHRGGLMKEFLHKLETLQASRFAWLLCRLASFDSAGDFYLFRDIWQMSDQNDMDFLPFFRSKQSTDHYIQLYEEMKQEDEPSDLVRQRETSYFQRDMIGLTVSRKLTLVSEWTCRYRKHDPKGIRQNGNNFVADDKLWKWVLESLNQAGLV
ncbi:hypothetical protein ACJ72_02844 [Emergomyces africanus]|uniref:Aminoglycoside phosphotransferase domain-containing protein n=1 Tax=Emergomyces africanus TaxID=1955775 RepID=A0A1B7P1T8_9EURO|nr:hypothetical protein ACJ72_02844 [Emergomyces africanus]